MRHGVVAFGAELHTEPFESCTRVRLGSFSSHGGKLIFYHGLSDPWLSAKDAIDYYPRMTAGKGGASKVTDWSRLSSHPAMGHCSGGSATLDNFDLLTASVNSVEKGHAIEWREPSRNPCAVQLSSGALGKPLRLVVDEKQIDRRRQ